MKSLQTIQVLSRIGKVLSKIVNICCTIGVLSCAIGIASLPFADTGFLKICDREYPFRILRRRDADGMV